MSAEVAIPILRFRAGSLPCAVAARDVRVVRGASVNHTPLWRLLGVPPAPIVDEEVYRSDSWVLGLAHGDASAELLVQGPIEILDVSASDLLRRPNALVLPNNDLIFGFVRCARELVLLLDIPALVELGS